MKKILLFSAAMALAAGSMAQKNKVSAARDYYADNEMVKAKQTIDEAVQHPESKESAEAWLMRANIYMGIALDKNLAPTMPNAVQESRTSVQRVIALNPKYDKEGVDAAIDRLMKKTLNSGIDLYNEKKYDSAYTAFMSVRDIFKEVGGANRFNDNTALQKSLAQYVRNAKKFAGINAYYAKRYDEAITVLEEMRKGIKNVDPKDAQDIYAFLLESYNATGNTGKYSEVLNEAAAKFPDDEVFRTAQMNEAIKSGESSTIIAKLEANPKLATDADLLYALANTYHRMAQAESRSSNPDTVALAESHYAKAEENYKAGMAVKDRAAFNQGLGLISYDRAGLLIGRMKNLGTSAADSKKYDQYSAESIKYLTQAQPFFEKAVSQYEAQGVEKLNKNELATYVATLRGLRDIYSRTNDTAKRKEVNDKIEANTIK